MIALFPSLGWPELFLLFVIGLLLYGRNLPQAGRSIGRVMAQLRRTFHEFKDQLDRDGEISDMKQAIDDTKREMRNVAKVPHAMARPKQALTDAVRDAITSDPADAEDASQASGTTDEADRASQDDSGAANSGKSEAS